MRVVFSIFISVILLCGFWFYTSLEASSDIRPSFSKDTISIRSPQKHKFRSDDFIVEIASSPEQRRYGLMYKKEMPKDQGMIFDFGEEQNITMWMKNTYIALDMIFVDKDRKIRHIHENAEPLSEVNISSKYPVKYVLELNAGIVKEKGIKVGDVVVY